MVVANCQLSKFQLAGVAKLADAQDSKFDDGTSETQQNSHQFSFRAHGLSLTNCE
jgi:hypothetical protein